MNGANCASLFYCLTGIGASRASRRRRFPASTGRQPEADKFAIGYVYNFSKRTALYATVAYLSNKNGAGLTVGGPAYFSTPIGGFAPVPDKSYGYDLGMRVSF